MRKGLKKALCGLLAGLMVAVTVPAALPETSFVTEVQAATKLATPQLVYAKPSGKNKILLKWKAVKGASGYRIYRRADGSAWKPLGNVNGTKKVVYTDTKTTTGVRYTYTVKAFKKVKGKYRWSGYDKKGLTTVAGLSTLKLNRSKVTLYTGKSYTLRINGTKAVPTWKSSNTKVATVSSKGVVTAKAAGTATITASLSGKTAAYKVTVKNPGITAKVAQVYVGKAAKVQVTTFGVSGKAKFATSNKKIATVSSTGVVTGKKAGTAKITVSVGNYKKVLTVKVKKPTFSLVKSSASLKKGKKVAIKVKAAPVAKVTYKTSNKKVATVSSKGVVTAKKKGTAKITVKCNGITRTFKVTVK